MASGRQDSNSKRKTSLGWSEGKFDDGSGTENLDSSTEGNGNLWPDITKKIMEIIDYHIIDLEENHICRLLDSVGRFNNKSKKNKTNEKKSSSFKDKE